MITVEGLDKLKGNLDKVGNNLYTDMLNAIDRTAEYIKTDAVKITPIDTGKLRQSAYVTQQGDDTYIYYTQDYSVKVHEGMHYRHKVGQAKFLEHAFNQWKPRINATIIKELGGKYR